MERFPYQCDLCRNFLCVLWYLPEKNGGNREANDIFRFTFSGWNYNRGIYCSQSIITFNRNRRRISVNGEQRDIPTTKTGSTKIYNAKDIVEAGRIIELLKEQGIAAFSQEASASVAMHGAPGFGMYGVDVLVEGDEAKKAIQIIEAADDSQNKEKF